MQQKEKFVIKLCQQIRENVLPYFGIKESRHISGKSISGDSTFLIDDVSENFIREYLGSIKSDIAYYSEDRGLVKFGSPSDLLIIDPIDGTRAAAAGLESSCISIALSDYTEEPKVKDLKIGCIQEVKSGRMFVALKEEGAYIIEGDKKYASSLSTNTDISSLLWSMGLRGRPIVPIAEVLEELIDSSNFTGSVFCLGSASFSFTKIVSGQLECYIDIGDRIIKDFPAMEKNYLRVAQGSILNNYPHDIAAAFLILKESGGIITDAYGKSLDEKPLMGIGRDLQLSMVASANYDLHRILMMMIEKGFHKLSSLVNINGI